MYYFIGMGLFYKTTSIEFQEFGEVFTETSFKNDMSSDRDYITVSNKPIDFLLKSSDNTYFRIKEGIAIVIVTNSLKNTPKAFVIHRVCHLKPNLYFNFVSLSNESVIEVLDFNESKSRHKIEEYSFGSLKPEVSVTSLLGSYYVVRGPNYIFPGETHNFWEITYIDDGELYTNVENIEYSLKPYNLLLYAPGQQHSVKTNKACSYLTLIFDMDISSEKAKKLKNKIFTVNQKEREYLLEINRLTKTDDFDNIDRIAALTQLLVCTLLSPQENKNQQVQTSMSQRYNNEFLSEIVLYIQEHIYEQLTVEDLCYEFALSRSSIQTLFKDNLDVLPKQYISDLKFAKAKQMMKESTYSLSQIAKFCGFSSIHYFSRKFKEKYGTTPSAYSKSIG